MISWLNSNQGFVMAVLTAVYVIATILILLSNRKAAKAAYDQLNEMKRQFSEDNKPFLAVYPQMTPTAKFAFEIKNIGKTYAKEINADFTQDVYKDFEDKRTSFDMKIANKDAILAPNQSLYYLYENSSLGSNIKTLFRMGVLRVKVTFLDEYNNKYETIQFVDTSFMNIDAMKYETR